MSDIPYFDAAAVRRALPMAACIDLMAETQAAISRGEMTLPQRSFLPVADGRSTLGVMPGETRSAFGAKLISLFPNNPAQGRPAIQGLIVTFDPETGTPRAVVDGAAVTAIRTAAASAAATRVLARPDASVLALLGYGVQAETHLEAMRCVREVREARVWGPNPAKSRRFAAQQSTPECPVAPAETAREALNSADLVCAVSSAPKPIIEGQWLSSGAHVNLVGAHSPTTREADGETLRRARIFTEITKFALSESGDLLIAIKEGHITQHDLCGEIGALIEGQIKGRRHKEEITLYISLGNTAQDLAAAKYIATSTH